MIKTSTQRLCLGCALLLLACAEAAKSEHENLAGAAGQGGTSGASGVTERPGLEILYEGEDAPYAVALDDRYLYWASGAGLRRAAIDGGEPVTIAALDSMASLVPAGDSLYFHLLHSYARSEVGRVSRESGEVQWFANEPNAIGLAVSDSAVFWAVGTNSLPGHLKQAGLDAAESSELATNLAFPRHLTLKGDQLYFGDAWTDCVENSPVLCVEPGIFRVSTAGGVPERLVSTEAASNPVWNDGSMYWLAADPLAWVVSVLPPGGTAQTIARSTAGIPSGSTALLSDAEALYWAAGTSVLRMPFATAGVESLVSGLEETSGLALRSGWVYVAERAQGRILRIAYRPSAE